MPDLRPLIEHHEQMAAISASKRRKAEARGDTNNGPRWRRYEAQHTAFADTLIAADAEVRRLLGGVREVKRLLAASKAPEAFRAEIAALEVLVP